MEYIDAQETVYSGWKKLHGIKVETVFLPNGISTVFGPVPARQKNCVTLALSGLDGFITLIQASLPLHERAMLFGDSIFHGLLQSITTYYRTIAQNIPTVPELKCNTALRSARQPIEKIWPYQLCSKNLQHQKRLSAGKKAPLCIGATQGLSPINELLYLFQW